MKSVKMNLKGLRKDKRGASLVEYSLLLGLVALAAVGLISSVGGSVNQIWTATDTQMSTAADTYAGGAGAGTGTGT
jgi:Flp pilus assembly pilin Flp